MRRSAVACSGSVQGHAGLVPLERLTDLAVSAMLAGKSLVGEIFGSLRDPVPHYKEEIVVR